MLTALILCLAVSAICSPADEVRAAAADVERLPPEIRPATRYLTIYPIAATDRSAALKTISYVLNALSRTRAISQPVVVSPTLVRFSISQFAPRKDEYGAWLAAWEKLAQNDPYFHLRTEVIANSTAQLAPKVPQNSATKITAGHRTPTRTVTVDGGWIDLNAAANLRSATQSTGAHLRADYFVAQTTATPHYYEFAGIPNKEDDFLNSLGLDVAVIDRLHANAGANLAISGVTAKPRRIVWAQGPLGGVYSTLDVEAVDAQRDPLRRPITAAGLAFRYDLGEWFALAPNGLWRTALFNASGNRQDSVPDRVAKDTSDAAADGIVVPLISCIRCHREAGLRPFVDDETKLLGGRIGLFSPDPNIIQRAVEFYDEARLNRQMKFDRETYTDAVAQATGGLTPEDLAQALAARVRNYAYLPVNLAQAAAEVGVTRADFRSALAATRDPVILLLLEGHPVLRGQWEASFAEAALAAQASIHSTRPR